MNRVHPGRSVRASVVVVLLAFLQLTIVSSTGWAAKDSQDTPSEAGLGAASVLLSIPYGIAKVTYALVGGITGGLAYVFTGGNEKAAKAIWDTSMRGTYIITPEHLKGEKAIRFLGVPPEAESGTGSSMAPSEASPMIQSEPAPAPGAKE